jgi:hypothetical protein
MLSSPQNFLCHLWKTMQWVSISATACRTTELQPSVSMHPMWTVNKIPFFTSENKYNFQSVYQILYTSDGAISMQPGDTFIPKFCHICKPLIQAGQSRNQIPVGAGFYVPVQTVPGAHPTSCTMGDVSPSWEVKRLMCGTDHPPTSSTEVKKWVQL